MPFKKGQSGNKKGKPKGAVNKTTKQTTDFLNDILLKRGESIDSALDKLKEEPLKYIDAISKLLPYVLPKKTDITTDGESFHINWIENKSK